MLEQLIAAALQYVLQPIINAVVAHLAANKGVPPTPAQVVATTAELALLAQGQHVLAAQRTPPVSIPAPAPVVSIT